MERTTNGDGERRLPVKSETDRGHAASVRVAVVAMLTVVSLLGASLTSVDAAPGETWSGTLQVTEQRVSESTDGNGNPTGSFNRLHVTSFFVEAVPGTDDDDYAQPLSGWETSLDERSDTFGRCPSYTTLSGQATGTDGRLQITPSTGGPVVIEVLDFGSPGTFPVTQRSRSCQDNVEQVSSTTYQHHSFRVQTSDDPAAHEFSGSVVQQLADGTITYEWNLVRAEEPTDGDDDLAGTDGDDEVELRGGNDIFTAGPGDDTVYGGTGDDGISGEGGADLLVGGDGSDTLSGGRGHDVIKGDGPNEISRSEALRTGDYSALAGGPDFLFGNGGRDRLVGGAGFDRFNGGRGKDLCIVGTRKEKRRARGCEVIRLRRSNR